MTSAVRSAQYPAHEWPEIVFLGRSNVGKSSLINYLCQRKNLARVSRTPGKTRTINFYQIMMTAKKVGLNNGIDTIERRKFCLVDLPGYGYAKVARCERVRWLDFIGEYLAASKKLAMVLQLIDIRHPPMESDREVHNWLVRQGFDLRIVATKADKLSKNEISRHLRFIDKDLPYSTGPILTSSAFARQGADELLVTIAKGIVREKQ